MTEGGDAVEAGFAPDDGGGRDHVGVDAAVPGGRDEGPRGGGAIARARVDDVVDAPAAGDPSPHPGCRAGQPASVDGDDLVDVGGGSRRLVGDPHGPAARERRSGDGDVSAQADEGRTVDLPGDAGGGAVGGEGLGRRAEVESDATGDARRPGPGIEVDVAVPGHRAEDLWHGRAAPRQDLVEVAVVAEGGDGVADRGVDGSGRATCHQAGHMESLVQMGADADGSAGPIVQGGELRVVPKPTAGQVHGVELRGQHELGRIRVPRVGDHHGGGGADGPEGAHAELSRSRFRGCGHDPEVPPDVTVGVDELFVGTEDEEDDEEDDEDDEDEPDDVEPEEEESDGVLEGDVVVVVPEKPDEVDGVVVEVPDPVPEVALAGLLEPGCSRATTTPMNAVRPVVANTAARVSVRTLAWARFLDSGVLG